MFAPATFSLFISEYPPNRGYFVSAGTLGKGLLGKLVTEEDLYDNVANAAGDIQHFAGSLRSSKGSVHWFIHDPTLYQRFLTASDSLNRFARKLGVSNGALSRLIEDGELYENLNSAVERLDAILARIEHDEGILGKLIIGEDPLIWQIRETLIEFKQLLADIRYDPQRYFSFKLY